MPADPTNPLAVFSKVALDQVLMAPCMTSMFFASMALLEGSRGSSVANTVKSKLKPTLLANWTVWPIAHVINFALVPPAQRILYINVINVSGGVAGRCWYCLQDSALLHSTASQTAV
jgi:protein Mpv17